MESKPLIHTPGEHATIKKLDAALILAREAKGGA